MNSKQTKRAMELLIENERANFQVKIGEIEIDCDEHYSLREIKNRLADLVIKLDELEILENNYSISYPKEEISYDDIPF